MNLFMHSFFLIYSITPIAIYSTTIGLNILLIILGIVTFGLNLTLFVFLRRIVRSEREKMLPIKILNLHAKEYTEDYNKNLRDIIGVQEINRPKIQNEEYIMDKQDN